MKYSVKKANATNVRKISEEFSLDMLSATIAERRNFSDKESLKFLLEGDLVYQNSPFLFYDMDSAVERIKAAIEDGEKIFIFGDRDTDGITSTAILYKELKRAGAVDIVCRLPLNDEPYGLTSDMVSEIIDSQATLLITVDNGISAIEEIKILRSVSIDTIVLDHHLAGEEYPPATALIDPKVPGSGYPFSGLAGCAVAFKTAYALRFSSSPLYQSELIFFHAKPGIDSVKMSAVKMVNFILEDSVTEELSLNMVSSSESRMIAFLNQGLPIIVMDKDLEQKALENAFTDSIEITFNDVRRDIESVIPSARNKSLFTLSNISRAVRYSDIEDKELAVLISLFRSTAIYKDKSLNEGLDEILALTAIGTVADLMPLRGENMLLVKAGLKIIQKNPAPYLLSLLSHLELLGKQITSKDISYYLAPLINASGRMGRPDVALSLFLAEDKSEIERLSKELIKMNKERKSSTEETLLKVKDEAENSLSFYLNRFILVENEIPRGLTGSIASRLLNENGKPSLVLAKTDDDRISASLRSKGNFNSREFLESFSHLFQDFGGHSYAAGFSMAKENLDKFKAELADKIFSLSDCEDEEEEIEVDAELPESYMGRDIWKIRDLFEPYGMDNECLKFHIKRAEIKEILPNRNNGKYLRCSILYNNEIWPAVYWAYDSSKTYVEKGSMVELIFSPEVNTYRGISRMQMNIIELENVT